MCGNAPFVFSYLTTRFWHSIGKSGVRELWEIADTLKSRNVYRIQNGWPIILSVLMFLDTF